MYKRVCFIHKMDPFDEIKSVLNEQNKLVRDIAQNRVDLSNLYQTYALRVHTACVEFAGQRKNSVTLLKNTFSSLNEPDLETEGSRKRAEVRMSQFKSRSLSGDLELDAFLKRVELLKTQFELEEMQLNRSLERLRKEYSMHSYPSWKQFEETAFARAFRNPYGEEE